MRTIARTSRWTVVLALFLPSLTVLQCSGPQEPSYDRSVVTTFAELSLLYEREKMYGKIADSAYQVKVDSFFRARAMDRDDFKKTIDRLSRNSAVWKQFIQDASRAIDSVRSGEKD